MHKRHPKQETKQSARKSQRKPTTNHIPQRSRCEDPEVIKSDSGGFLDLLSGRISWEELESLEQRRHAAGRPAQVLSRPQLLVGLIFHFTVSWAGSFAEHLFCLLQIDMAESSLSQRRQALPFAIFAELLRRILRPITHAGEEGLFKCWRLVALDGVSFSLANTKQVNAQCKKGGNQRGRAAFAKLQCAVLLELLMHNPLAAAVATAKSEWQLGLELLAQLPERCLLLADRLYGCGAFLLPLCERLKQCNGRFLVRVKGNLKVVRRLRVLADGSRLVQVHALNPFNYHQVIGTLEVREIRATVSRRGHRSAHIRLWTNLSLEKASAKELVDLYMARWEQELYFRELKWHLGINDLLRSQTPETAAQEVAAMIIGSSLIAHERAKLKPGEALTHRISFIKTWETLEPLWLALLLGEDILTEEQKQQLCERFYALAARRVMPKKRQRSCPRVLRQPQQPWSRKRNQKSSDGPLRISISKRWKE